VALLSPLPEYFGRLFVIKRPAAAPPSSTGRQGVDVRAQLWHLDHPSVGDLRLHELERQLRISLLHAYTLLETATDAQLATDWAQETNGLILRHLGPQEARRFWDGNRPPVDNVGSVRKWIEAHCQRLEDLSKRLPFTHLTDNPDIDPPRGGGRGGEL